MSKYAPCSVPTYLQPILIQIDLHQNGLKIIGHMRKKTKGRKGAKSNEKGMKKEPKQNEKGTKKERKGNEKGT